MFKGRLAEFILHITNLVYFCSGVVILTLGAVAIASPASIINVMGYIPKINSLSYIMALNSIALGPAIYLIVEGSLAIILSFVGCGGAFKRKIPIVLTFGIITLLMMLFNLAIIMWYMIDSTNAVSGTVQYNMNMTLTSSTNPFHPITIIGSNTVDYPSNITDLSSYYWNVMQSTESCCGVLGYEDYQYVQWNTSAYNNINVATALVPASCCMTTISQQLPSFMTDFVNVTACLGSTIASPTYVYKQGCINYVLPIVTQYNYVWAVAAAGFTGLQAIILGLSLWLLVHHHK